MAATKDQRRLLNRCMSEDIPVFIITGADKCALSALEAYLQEAERIGCEESFIHDMKTNIIPDFKDFQTQEPEKVKIPD